MSGMWGALWGIGVTWLAGSLLCAGLLPFALRERPGFASTTLACGFLVGAALVGAIMTLAAGSPNDYLWAQGGLILASAFGLARRPWQSDAPGGDARWLVITLTLLALPTVGLAVVEVLQRPLLGWDAWTVWSVKPKTWFGAGSGIEFVGFPAWLAASDPLVHGTPAWHYPELIGRYVLWQARWVGSWNEHLVHLPWIPVWLSLMAGSYGLLRLNGRSAGFAGIVTALLVTAPFIAMHMVLPGYMDLWTGTVVLLACGVFAVWLDQRRAGVLVLGLVMLAMLIGIKVEGLIWAGIIGAAVVFALPSRRVALGGLAAALVLATGWWALGGIEMALGGRPWVFSPELIDLPYIGRFELAFTNRLAPFAQALLVLPNWHVLGVLTGIGALIGLASGFGTPRYRLCYAVLVLGAAFLFVLFNFTPAGIWAENLTASNRLTLHLFPAAFWLVMLHLDSAAASGEREA
ncbi:MAG: hypothetical protein R3200_02200 [Xanthomonadales bacterium]|nr:hypothetical protein [Xanthomonadales bacterium]